MTRSTVQSQGLIKVFRANLNAQQRAGSKVQVSQTGSRLECLLCMLAPATFKSTSSIIFKGPPNRDSKPPTSRLSGHTTTGPRSATRTQASSNLSTTKGPFASSQG